MKVETWLNGGLSLVCAGLAVAGSLIAWDLASGPIRWFMVLFSVFFVLYAIHHGRQAARGNGKSET